MSSSFFSRIVVGGVSALSLGVVLFSAGCSGGEISIGKDDNALKNGPGSCAYDGKRYANGEGFPSTDGCNSCSCNDGNVACTLRACALDAGPAPGSCTYDGKTYANGATFRSTDGCNGCGCNDGMVACTLLACALDAGPGPSCTYDGKTYSAGDSFPATDGCNDCTCQSSGQVFCTLRACALDAGSGPG